MFLVLYLISIVVFYISLFVVSVLVKHQLKKDEMYEKFKEYDSHKNLLNRIKEKSQTVIISVIPILNLIIAVTFFVTIDSLYEQILSKLETPLEQDIHKFNQYLQKVFDEKENKI